MESNDFIVTPYNGKIYLYGEKHGVKKTINEEFTIWNEHYESGMRHLFIETAYFTAEYLNLWMGDEEDVRLYEVYSDWEGTASHNPYILNFYKRIKKTCPETIFHGTDVGHQYFSTGLRYLNYLEKNGLSESENYKITKHVIDQGSQYYNSNNDIYRENKMVENFIRELHSVDHEHIMGIYGTAHTNLNKKDFTRSIPCMASQLNSIYDGQVFSVDLSKAYRK
ncbi:hypothetical protein EXM22_09185 [Oceanispirochaeta crateris]|uniref:Uncharacterized protein n=1 Tax=Oceanispirochaeta crateris TaxID=2518645 RepID=A0A5C1QPV0_9SPIO|nr:hypothetical protein [Oceanispirochaeta crateris]QEN08152.1 hypothetical protein EXM22_09185 [Oceanispirochaeta crateris]